MLIDIFLLDHFIHNIDYVKNTKNSAIVFKQYNNKKHFTGRCSLVVRATGIKSRGRVF